MTTTRDSVTRGSPSPRSAATASVLSGRAGATLLSRLLLSAPPDSAAALAAHALTAEADAADGGADTPSLVLSLACCLMLGLEPPPIAAGSAPARWLQCAADAAGGAAAASPKSRMAYPTTFLHDAPPAKGGGAAPAAKTDSARFRFGAWLYARHTARLDGVVGVEAFEVVCARLSNGAAGGGRAHRLGKLAPLTDSADCFGALRCLSDAFGSGGAVALGGARALLAPRRSGKTAGARLDLSLLATPPATSTLSSGSPTQSVQLQAQAEPLLRVLMSSSSPISASWLPKGWPAIGRGAALLHSMFKRSPLPAEVRTKVREAIATSRRAPRARGRRARRRRASS